jgi:putative flippase GtrA
MQDRSKRNAIPVRERTPKPVQQFVRYILVGGFNTVFGYGLFALLNWLSRGLGPYNYLYAGVLANLIAISVAFLGYKWFVFRTRGNYLSEYIRCFGVYGSSALIGLAGLSILVPILRRSLRRPEEAPYMAAAMMTVVTMVISFLGHKNISFRPKRADDDADSSAKTPLA